MAGPLRYLARIGKRLRSNAGVTLVSVLAGAASINVACKGFELLLYDSDDLEDPRPSLPRAVYVSGSRGCRDLRDRDRRRADARPRSADRRQRGSVAFGRRPTRPRYRRRVGRHRYVTVRHVVGDQRNSLLARPPGAGSHIGQELPARLGHARGGLPATATSVLTLIAAGLAMAPGVTQ